MVVISSIVSTITIVLRKKPTVRVNQKEKNRTKDVHDYLGEEHRSRFDLNVW